MRKKITITLLTFAFLATSLMAQKSNLLPEANGYISVLPSMYFDSDTVLWQTLVHNRLNFNWQGGKHLSASVSMRNQVISGDFVNAITYERGFTTEQYFLPLTLQQPVGASNLLSLSVDRAWVQYTHNQLEVKVGRQRINWGQTFVWNPNDIFNTYNYFEFDYPERPGADALRIQYYTSGTSSVDFGIKADSAGNISAASLVRFNRWNYDFQVLAGYFSQSNQTILYDPFPHINLYDEKDIILGGGFSGAIKSMSLRGEVTYFHSTLAGQDSSNLFLLSVGVDYTFGNNLGLMGEFLYNSNVLLPASAGFLNFSAGNLSVKSMSYTQYNYFAQGSYPTTPIVTLTLAGMCFTDENMLGFYAGPNLSVSLSDNMTLASVFQLFRFKLKNVPDPLDKWQNAGFAFLQWKWNF